MKVRCLTAALLGFVSLFLTGRSVLPSEEENEIARGGAAKADGIRSAQGGVTAVKATIILTPGKGFGDWAPTKVLQMNGDTVTRELPAEHQLIMDASNREVSSPYLLYMPERDKLLMLMNRENPYKALPRDSMLMSSKDHGRTWGNPTFWNPKHLDPLTGTAAIEAEELSERHAVALTYLGDGNLIMSGANHWFSHDYGETWEGPTAIPPASNGDQVILWDPYLVDRDSKTGKVTRLVQPGCTDTGGWPGLRSFVRFSYDGGLTWPEEIAPPSWNGPTGTGASEKALCRARNGTIIVACRIRNAMVIKERNDHYSGLGISLSKDDGHTWTKVKVLYDYGRHHPSMVLMPKGEIVMTYVVRLGQLAKEYGGLRDQDGFGQWRIEAVVSRDNGESWMAHRYVLAKWSGTSQAQSTSTVLLPDGSLLTAFGAGYRGTTGGLGYLGDGKSVPVDKERQLGPLDIALVRWRPGPD